MMIDDDVDDDIDINDDDIDDIGTISGLEGVA